MISYFTFSTTALPVPIVTITTDGAPIVGKNFSLNCSAEFDRNVATVNLEWLRDGFSLASSNSDGFLILNIISVSVSDEGTYTCVATLDIAGLEVPRNTTANAAYEFLTLGKVHESHFFSA